MKHAIPILGLLIGLVTVSAALAQSSLYVGGYLRQETSVLLDGGEYALIRNTVDLNIEHSMSDFALRIDPYAYQVPGEELELGIRQAYLDFYWSSVDLRLGRQQIVWGKADGMFITDIVSPKDLGQFLLADFEEIRSGVDAIKLNYYRGNSTLELVWLPSFTATQMPEAGSLWEIKPQFPIQPSMDMSRSEVTGSLENSEIFGKISLLSSFADLELMAGYAWDDDPSLHMDAQVDPYTQELTSLKITPEHHRLALTGGSFSTEVEGFILRGEGAYYWDKVFNTTNLALGDGTLERDYVHYLLGVDRPLFGLNTSLQFSQEVVLDFDESLARGETREVMTVLLSDDFLGETLHLEFFSYLGLTDGDALLRPKIIYDMSDGLELTLGSDIFIGDEGMFGGFDANDLLYVKARYSF
jgi:hypothetical protein